MSLSYKQVRISPRQGSFNDSGQTNIVDVEINGGNYDLSQSSLVIDCLVNHTSTEPVVNGTGDNSGVFDSVLLFQDSADGNYNKLVTGQKDYLIKNARVESSKLGLLDSSIDHNSFKTNLNAITMSNEEQNSELQGNSVNFQDQGLIKNQSMALLVKGGAQPSVQKSNELVIPLKNVFPSHIINNYQSSLHGNLTYHFELRLNQLTASAVQTSDATMGTAYNDGGDTNNSHTYGAFDDTPTNSTGDSVNLTQLTTTIQYKSLTDSPYYVSQKLQLSYTEESAAAVTNQIVKIISIEYLNTNDANNGKLKLTVDGYWLSLPHDKNVTLTSARMLNPTTSTLQINSIQLKMMELENAPSIKTPQTISYPYYTTHKDSYSESHHQTRNYYIPPLTKTCFILFPEKGSDKTFSKDAITNYRFIVDNIPVTDTKILYNSAKHYDLMRASFMNAGLPIKNVGSYFKNYDHKVDITNEDQKEDITVLAFPVKTKAEQQVLNLELNASSTLSGQIQIVYQRVKQVVAK